MWKKVSKGKRLSNPFSTGGGGPHFEVKVQASFVVLMLTGGFVPCMPNWPISRIKLQGRYKGYETDDMIVFVENAISGQKRKILGQIKHSINITKNNSLFADVIQAAWHDFNNKELFSKGTDAIVLITGPLNTTDINDSRIILEWARNSENADDYIKKVGLANFSSQRKQAKLQAFKANLIKANGGKSVSDEILFEFLKHFHLLSFDLDIKNGVTLALLHSIIGQYSADNASSIWVRIIDEVQTANQNAGTITLENLPDELCNVFKHPSITLIPEKLSRVKFKIDITDLDNLTFISDLALINLIGSWNEQNTSDLEVINQLTKKDYNTWIVKIREVLQQSIIPITLKNGRWSITDRKVLWKILSKRLYDSNIDDFKRILIEVLTERSPKFELPKEQRYAAFIHSKVLKYSPELRKGLTESLALLGNNPDDLVNCSIDLPEKVAYLAVKDILSKADWMLWGSLNDLLPTLAEAEPEAFLKVVEETMQQPECPFNSLFKQEGLDIFGENYMTGLLWALETLAWEEKYLIRVCLILGELDIIDSGGNWANRPLNSLLTILLPWLPQTCANINKRKATLITLQRELPNVAWKLVICLLPNHNQVSMGTHKPIWRKSISDKCGKAVSQKEYYEYIKFISEVAISIAKKDRSKLSELIMHLDSISPTSLNKVLKILSSNFITKRPEEERLDLWTNLKEFVIRQKRYLTTNATLDTKIIFSIEDSVSKLTPKNPLNLHRSLFSDRALDLFDETNNWTEQEQKLENLRQQAIGEILAYGKIESVIKFSETVDASYYVGTSLGHFANIEMDSFLLPKFLAAENKKLELLILGYVKTRQLDQSWLWVDSIEKSTLSKNQIINFLCCLPFVNETWIRASNWLGQSEKEYWERTEVNPYQCLNNMDIALDKLIENGRPNAAIRCLYYALIKKYPLDKKRSVKALLTSLKSKETSYSGDTHHVIELIKALQNDPETDSDELFQIEWMYLPLLERHQGASPKLIEKRLAEHAEFFCEVISLMYRSTNETLPIHEPNETDKAIALNAWRLLQDWRIPPGLGLDGNIMSEKFKKWIHEVIKICTKTGHLDVAFSHIGSVLIYCPPDPQGLWIDQTVADTLNSKDAESMRAGFQRSLYNSRGAHMVDPSGKPEQDLAENYKQKAEEVENAGFSRLAITLRRLADSYLKDAERIVNGYYDYRNN